MDDVGLTLHFELRLPATNSCDDVQEKLARLRDFALSTRADLVTPILSLAGEPTEQRKHDKGIELSELFDVWIEIMREMPLDGDGPTFEYDRNGASGFAVLGFAAVGARCREEIDVAVASSA